VVFKPFRFETRFERSESVKMHVSCYPAYWCRLTILLLLLLLLYAGPL
jgi:hypothetical protein